MRRRTQKELRFRPDALVEFLEAAYDLEADDQSWLARVLAAGRAVPAPVPELPLDIVASTLPSTSEVPNLALELPLHPAGSEAATGNAAHALLQLPFIANLAQDNEAMTGRDAQVRDARRGATAPNGAVGFPLRDPWGSGPG